MLHRKHAALRGGTPFERRAKLMRYGLSLGYDYSTVTDCVENIVKDIGNEE
jgi:regulatory protein